MMLTVKQSTILLSLLGIFSTSVTAVPMDFSFTGTFVNDDDVQLFNFTASGASNVRLISYSYAGGTQSNGNVVAAGGFDPILAVFDSAGNLVGQNDDSGSFTSGACGSGVVNTDPVTGEEYDTCFEQVLSAGTYTVSIMQFANFANGPTLANGFSETGDPNFTNDFNCSNGQFCDFNADNRTSAWAFDILNVESAASVPEPTTLALMGLGLAGIGYRRHHSKKAA